MSRQKRDKKLARIIARNLLFLRKSRGAFQKDVAEATGLHLSVVNLAESGQVEPTLYTLRKLADYYGVTIDELTINNNF